MPKSSIPEFIIDLNLAPEDRFAELGHFYGSELVDFLNEMRTSFTSEILESLESNTTIASKIEGLLALLLRSALPFSSIPFGHKKAVQFLLKIAGVNSLEVALNAVIDSSLWAVSKTLAAHEYMRELKWFS